MDGYLDNEELKHLSDIEKTLMKIDEVASSQDGIAAEEALILRGYVQLTPSRARF